MAARTRLKILTTSSTTTTPNILKTGELAYSYEAVSAGQGQAGERLYIGTGAEDSNGVASSVQIIGGKYFTDLLDHAHGSLQPSSALITNSDSKLLQLKVDNLDLNGNTISSTNTNGNIVIDPAGTGKLVLHNVYINGTSDTLAEFIYDTVGGAVTGTAGSVVVTNDDAGNTSTISLADQITAAGPVGSATAVPVITFNSKGQLTTVTTAAISTSFTISDGSATDTFNNGQTLVFAGTNDEITTAVTNNQVQIGLPDDVTIGNDLTVTGNLIVSGTTTTVNSTTVTIDDPIFTLGGDTAPSSDDNKDRGIEFRWHDGTDAKLGFFGFDDSDGPSFKFIADATNTSEVFSGNLGNAKFGGVNAGTVVAGVTAGTVTTSSGKLILDSADGEVEINDNVDLNGTLNVSGAVTLGVDLTVANGGTGRSSFTNNGIVYGDGANALDVTAAGSQYDILQAGANGVPEFSAIIDGGTY